MSEADLARKEALDGLEWKIRALTANLLRIIRGAGKPHEFMRQVIELAEALEGYYAAFGVWPFADEMARVLNVFPDLQTVLSWNEEVRSWKDAERQIISGVLQIVASRLVGQKTQETFGRSEMFDGLRALEANRREAQKAIQAKSRTNEAKRPKRGRPRKPT